ncbi:MAG: phage portal protein [Treponema sp.]|jgi:hypothetical protein|nr:phage portal protein [Treponema sp.]
MRIPFFTKRANSRNETKNFEDRDACQSVENFFDESEIPGVFYGLDSYRYSAWVNIAVNILIRNIARADFVIKRGGDDVTAGLLYDLFRRPNTALSSYGLWKETAAWWFLEGEACDRRSLRWFGPEYGGGLPRYLFVLRV